MVSYPITITIAVIALIVIGVFFFKMQLQLDNKPATINESHSTTLASDNEFCNADDDCGLLLCSGCFSKEFLKTAPPDLPCTAYVGYSCKCTENKCTAIISDDEVSCKATGGEWLRVGLAQQFRCIRKYTDGGKPCNSSNECLGSCLPTDYGKGYCKYDDNNFGCHTTIEDFKAGIPALCVD